MFFVTLVSVIVVVNAESPYWITHGQMLISPYASGYYIVATPKVPTTAEPPVEIIPSVELDLDQMAFASEVKQMQPEMIAMSLFRPETVNSFQKLFPNFVERVGTSEKVTESPVRIYVDKEGFVKVSNSGDPDDFRKLS